MKFSIGRAAKNPFSPALCNNRFCASFNAQWIVLLHVRFAVSHQFMMQLCTIDVFELFLFVVFFFCFFAIFREQLWARTIETESNNVEKQFWNEEELQMQSHYPELRCHSTNAIVTIINVTYSIHVPRHFFFSLFGSQIMKMDTWFFHLPCFYAPNGNSTRCGVTKPGECAAPRNIRCIGESLTNLNDGMAFFSGWFAS